MLLDDMIKTFEDLKKNVYIIDRGDLKPLIIRFKDEHFYHLAGLHKTNINMFFPKEIRSRAKQYKHMKNNIEKYNNIIINQIKGKYLLELRINTFCYITEILKDNSGATLYRFKDKVAGSRYDGDYGLFKLFEDIYCLLGLKENADDNICYPQSWMPSNRMHKLAMRPPKSYNKIIVIPTKIYDNSEIYAV